MGHCTSERAGEQDEMENEDRQLCEKLEEQLGRKRYGRNRSQPLKKEKRTKKKKGCGRATQLLKTKQLGWGKKQPSYC